MASRNSYSHQKELLVKLQEALEVFRQDMSNVARNYKNTVQSLHEEEGMMDETYEEYYINYLNPTVEVLNNMLERIDNEDIAFIEKELGFLSSR